MQKSLLYLIICIFFGGIFGIQAYADDGKPGVPSIGWTPSVLEKDFTITASMPWGENGERANLLESGSSIATVNLSLNTPNSQKIVLSATNQPFGKHTYVIELCNNLGCSLSNAVTAFVAPKMVGGAYSGDTTKTGATLPVSKDTKEIVAIKQIPVAPPENNKVSTPIERKVQQTVVSKNITRSSSSRSGNILSFVTSPGFSQDLQLKSSGDAVTALQNWLQSNGLFSAKVDGVYGITTRSAVVRLQKLSGISATGRWDIEARTFFGKKYLEIQ